MQTLLISLGAIAMVFLAIAMLRVDRVMTTDENIIEKNKVQ